MKKENSNLKYLRMRDILSMYPISRTTYYNWIRQGLITPIKIGSISVVSAEQMEQLFSGNI